MWVEGVDAGGGGGAEAKALKAWLCRFFHFIGTLGVRVTVVSLCVCLSVTTLTATYIVCKAEVRYHNMVLYGVLQICNVWLSLKTLLSKVMALFAYHCCLPRSLTSSPWTEEIAVSSFLDEECIRSSIAPVND